MTDVDNGGASRLQRLRQKHKALLSTSSQRIAQSRSRLDWYSDEFEGSGRKFFFQENGKKPSQEGEALAAAAEGTAEEEGGKPGTGKARRRRSSTSLKLKEENTKLKEELKELQAEREKLRKNLSQVAVQVQNASKAILSTKVHEANAKLSAMEIDHNETKERLEAKEASQTELLTQMQKLRKENAKLGSQVRLNSHAMSGTKNNKIKQLQECITDLEETNRDLTLEKAKIDAQMRIEQEDSFEGMTKAKKKKTSKERSKGSKDLEHIRRSNMTMIQTQLAVSAAQLTSAEMDVADKEHEISELVRSLDQKQADNDRLRKNQGGTANANKIDELEKEVKDLESVNQQLIQEKMETSMSSIQEDALMEVSGGAPATKLQKRVRSSNITMMQTKLALSSAQLSSVEQDVADKEHELMGTELRLDEANKQLDHALKGKIEAEKKLQAEITKAYELEKTRARHVNISSSAPVEIPTNIAVGVGNGEIGGTFDFAAAVPGTEAEDASVKVIHLSGDDQTARSAMTGYTDASSMAQTYAVTIVQTKLVDSYAKYADLELKFSELKSTLDSAMVEIGTNQSAADTQAVDLSDARDKNATYQATMANLKAEIAVLEDKQLKGLKRQMRKARRAEEDGDDNDEEEEEEVIPIREHRSTVAILNTKLQEAFVKISTMEREMDELADMLESTLIDGEGKRAIISSLQDEIIETRKENADLYTQVHEFEAMNDVFEGARVFDLETKMMGLEMMNQQLMLQQLEDEDAANSALPYGVDEDNDNEADQRGSKVENLERKIHDLEQMNKALSVRKSITSAPISEGSNDDQSSSSSSSS